MGNNISYLTEQQFKQQWRLVQIQRESSHQLWQHIENPSNHVQRYLEDDRKILFDQQLCKLRWNNPYLVNACALKKNSPILNCEGLIRELFVEVIPFRLSNVKDIPYPDALHLYDAAIHGFGQLSEAVGPFGVDEDMVGIDEKGRVKVWLSSQFQSFRVQGAKVTEPVMVKGLLTILDAAVDHSASSGYPHVGRFIGSHDNVTFKQARERFNFYLGINGRQVPQTLYHRKEINAGKRNKIEVVSKSRSQLPQPIILSPVRNSKEGAIRDKRVTRHVLFTPNAPSEHRVISELPPKSQLNPEEDRGPEYGQAKEVAEKNNQNCSEIRRSLIDPFYVAVTHVEGQSTHSQLRQKYWRNRYSRLPAFIAKGIQSVVHNPQKVETKPKVFMNTSKMSQNRQEGATPNKKGSAVVIEPVRDQDNKRQEYKFIPLRIELKEEVGPLGGMTKQTKFDQQQLLKQHANNKHRGQEFNQRIEVFKKQKYELNHYPPKEDGTSSEQVFKLLLPRLQQSRPNGYSPYS